MIDEGEMRTCTKMLIKCNSLKLRVEIIANIADSYSPFDLFLNFINKIKTQQLKGIVIPEKLANFLHSTFVQIIQIIIRIYCLFQVANYFSFLRIESNCDLRKVHKTFGKSDTTRTHHNMFYRGVILTNGQDTPFSKSEFFRLYIKNYLT